jgi:hypothetical protein
MAETSEQDLLKMTEIRKPRNSEMGQSLDHSWEGVKTSWAETWRRSKLFAKYLPAELLDAADLYISSKVEEVKESVTSRLTRTRDRIKSTAVNRIVRWIEFGKKIVVFKFMKKKLGRLTRKIEQCNAENYVEELKKDIGNRLTGLQTVSTKEPKEGHVSLSRT